MFHLIRDSYKVWGGRVLAFVLGGLVVGIGLNSVGTADSSSEKLVFLVGNHCETEVKNFLAELRSAKFSTSLQEINYDNGEFSQVGYVASIGHHNFKVDDLESYGNGAMAKCWASSFAKYDLDDREDIENAISYIGMLKRHGDDPILVSIDDGVMTVRAKKNN